MLNHMQSWEKQNYAHTHTHRFSYLGDIEQVDLQEEGRGAGSHLLGRTTDGETQLAA